MTRFIKNPDEIILEDLKMVHYEVMEEGRFVWMGIYSNDGKIYHLNISVNSAGRLNVYYSNETPD